MSTEPLELIVGRKVLERFRQSNAARQAPGQPSGSRHRKIGGRHVGPVPLRAEAVRAQLPSPNRTRT